MARKKTAAQLQREIDEALAKPHSDPTEDDIQAYNDILAMKQIDKPSVGVARAGLEASRKHGIKNLQYGLYRHVGDSNFTWGTFTGRPGDVIVAIEPSNKTVASQTALVRALLAQLSDEQRVALDLVLESRNGSAQKRLAELVPYKEDRAFIKTMASQVKALRAR